MIPLSLSELNSCYDSAWDTLISESPECGFMQSSAWAAFKQLEGYHTPRFGLFEGDRLIGGGSMLHYPNRHGTGYIICPEGPCLPWDNLPMARQGLRLLSNAVESYLPAPGAVGFRIEPHIQPPSPSLLRNWKRAPVNLTPADTLILDLTQPEETLLASMHPKGRYNLRLAYRHGIQVIHSTNMNDLSTFFALFEETARRDDFFAEPYGFFLNLGAALFPSGMAELLLANDGGSISAAILMIYFGRRATYLYGGSSSQSRAHMPNYALQWEAINSARNRGCMEYDFYGIDPFGHPDHLYSGITRFKRQFGGLAVRYTGAHDLIFYDNLSEQILSELQKSSQGYSR